MSHSLRFKKGSSVLYTFDVCPFVTFGNEYITDDEEPRALVAVGRSWTLDGVLLGTSSAIATALAALYAVLEDEDDYPDTVEFLSGSTVVASIVQEDEFAIATSELPKTDSHFRSEIPYRIKITSMNRVADKVQVAPFSDETTYDGAGLATRTIEGEVLTKRGTSAVEFAQTLGLDIPDATWAAVTNGPKRTNYRALNKGDTRASFRSTLQQSGGKLPGGVSADYSQETEEVSTNGVTLRTITARATGVGAEAAVRSVNPGDATHTVIRTDPWRREASATFSQVTPEFFLQHHYSVRPGGPGIGFTLRLNARDPLDHDLPRQPCEITEDFTQRIKGTPKSDAFKAPAALEGFREDPSARVVVPRHLVSLGAGGAAGDVWEASMHRVYRAASAGDFFAAIDKAVQASRSGGSVPFTDASGDGSTPFLFGIPGVTAPTEASTGKFTFGG